MSWQLPLIGLFLALALIGLVSTLKRKDQPLGKPVRDPRRDLHRDWSIK